MAKEIRVEPMTAEEEVLAQTRSIEEWLSDREALFLYSLARLCVGKGVIVEIGSWKGKSTLCLALGSLAGNRIPVYAVDPHNCAYDSTGSLIRHAHLTTFDEFHENLRKARLEEMVHAIVRSSDDALKDWDLPIELLWIDGDHAYEAVRRDIEGWRPSGQWREGPPPRFDVWGERHNQAGCDGIRAGKPILQGRPRG